MGPRSKAAATCRLSRHGGNARSGKLHGERPPLAGGSPNRERIDPRSSAGALAVFECCAATSDDSSLSGLRIDSIDIFEYSSAVIELALCVGCRPTNGQAFLKAGKNKREWP